MESNNFDSFDPLKYKSVADTEAATKALRREIKEILGSYVGWYDPFSELIQNALDSVESRKKKNEINYEPKIRIIINLQKQNITVTDNGMGLNKSEFNQFLIPFYSFKSGETRGHKGVGATYLAYGFNYIQIAAKSDDFSVCGKMINARNWLFDENPSGNPEVEHDNSGPNDNEFSSFSQGVSVTLHVDSTTHPKDLTWIGITSAASWFSVLSIKTGLGAIFENKGIEIYLEIIDPNDVSDTLIKKGISYLYTEYLPNVKRSIRIRDLQQKTDEYYKKKGLQARLPSALQNFDCIFEYWKTDEINNIIELDEDDNAIMRKHMPTIYCGYTYSARIFSDFNDSLGLRSNYKIISGGFQIASNNMPQGEIFTIPLQRYIGRQNQIHFLLHFVNYSPDLGRKGYKKDIVDFCKNVTEKISTKFLNKFKPYLKPSTGTVTDIIKSKKISDWKNEMNIYEEKNPLNLLNDKFFLPTRKIGITSKPTREQDVIALFNQLIAGGVIRGIRLMSTNERFTYDGLYKIIIDKPVQHHIYEFNENPLGILSEKFSENDLPFYSNPEILEYKYSLDGLIEDISDETKNSNDISLVIVWETGNLYKGNFHITSLLDDYNIHYRHYHGVTHVVTNVTTDQKEMDLIVLSELISFLNDPTLEIENQRRKYEE
ncbi:hypothetical protein [Larkinella sp.]|uniref:hypothetical protein n=1 Tax=Larkinella sp. TaxID=2034517 RepID=UPI003BA9AB93